MYLSELLYLFRWSSLLLLYRTNEHISFYIPREENCFAMCIKSNNVKTFWKFFFADGTSNKKFWMALLFFWTDQIKTLFSLSYGGLWVTQLLFESNYRDSKIPKNQMSCSIFDSLQINSTDSALRNTSTVILSKHRRGWRWSSGSGCFAAHFFQDIWDEVLSPISVKLYFNSPRSVAHWHLGSAHG